MLPSVEEVPNLWEWPTNDSSSFETHATGGSPWWILPGWPQVRGWIVHKSRIESNMPVRRRKDSMKWFLVIFWYILIHEHQRAFIQHLMETDAGTQSQTLGWAWSILQKEKKDCRYQIGQGHHKNMADRVNYPGLRVAYRDSSDNEAIYMGLT